MIETAARTAERAAVARGQGSRPTTPVALKEWAVVCHALLTGRQVVLVRKGGIHEARTGFRAEYDSFYLYPNTEHESLEQLQSAARPRLSPYGPPPQDTGTVLLPGYCHVVDVVPIDPESEPDRLRALEPLTIWSQPYFDLRLAYKPERPVYVLTLRAYCFPKPLAIPYLAAYGGCRSWVPLRTAVAAAPAEPALGDAAFQAQRRAVLETLG